MKICKSLVSNKTNISNCHILEVVGRGSKTLLQLRDFCFKAVLQRFRLFLADAYQGYSEILQWPMILVGSVQVSQ